MHSKYVYFIVRKKTKIALQVLPCFISDRAGVIKNEYFFYCGIYLHCSICGFSITDNWQSHKSEVNVATADGKYSVFKGSCCKHKKYQKTGYGAEGLTLDPG